jgi:hypothetical protein
MLDLMMKMMPAETMKEKAIEYAPFLFEKVEEVLSREFTSEAFYKIEKVGADDFKISVFLFNQVESLSEMLPVEELLISEVIQSAKEMSVEEIKAVFEKLV